MQYHDLHDKLTKNRINNEINYIFSRRGSSMSKKDYPRKAKSHDNYSTDQWIKQLFDGWFDPCPLNPDWTYDGLKIEWPNRTFVNPPYSDPLPWVEKAIETSMMNRSIALLLKHDSSTKWWRRLHEANAHFMPIIGRLKHGTPRAAAFPSVIVFLEGVDL